MKINRVTMTGADESVSANDLVAVSLKYPHTEWGVLFSKRQEGSKRFPSLDWSIRFGQVAAEYNLQCSAHLCGAWVRELVSHGRPGWFKDRDYLLSTYQRIQINFHAESHATHPDFLKILADLGDKQFIFQVDNVNNWILDDCLAYGINVVPLFDTSGGIGVAPDSWPAQIPGVYCGYAGGLGPDSIAHELQRINAVVGDDPIWIDMETKVRSQNDSQFDLAKVEQCLEQAAPWVSP